MTVPRQAASVLLLRGGADALEVLLVKRIPSRPVSWAARGCSPAARSTPTRARATRRIAQAAIRETEEEAGVTLTDPARIVQFSRWITPAQVKVRFDTYFFLAPLPGGAEPAIDGDECVDLGWFTPQGALDAHTRGEILLVFPTIKHFEQIAPFESRRRPARAHAAAARSRRWSPRSS